MYRNTGIALIILLLFSCSTGSEKNFKVPASSSHSFVYDYAELLLEDGGIQDLAPLSNDGVAAQFKITPSSGYCHIGKRITSWEYYCIFRLKGVSNLGHAKLQHKIYKEDGEVFYKNQNPINFSLEDFLYKPNFHKVFAKNDNLYLYIEYDIVDSPWGKQDKLNNTEKGEGFRILDKGENIPPLFLKIEINNDSYKSL